jgi:hypothetical protein
MKTNDLVVEYRPFPKLTKEFVGERIEAGWKDLVWAASNHWLDTKALADLADAIPGASDDARVAVAIAAMDRDDAALKAVLDEQARNDVVSEAVVRERWMRLVVAWLYLNRGLFEDPWAAIEQVWEAFGHAPELNGLIRWMPVPPGGEPGEQGMLKRWREFVDIPARRVR